MSALKRKSSVALIIGIIIMLALIPIFFTTIVPYFVSSNIASGLETINTIQTEQGYVGGEYSGTWVNVPMIITTHAYTASIVGSEVTIEADTYAERTDTINLTSPWAVQLTDPVGSRWIATSAADHGNEYTVISWNDTELNGKLSAGDQIEMTGPIENRSYDVKSVQISTVPGVWSTMSVANESLPRFDGTTTMVVNANTGQYVGSYEWNGNEWVATTEQGYATLYPHPLKAGESIYPIWVDSLGTTGTLKFNGSVVVQGVTLFRYTLNESKTEIDNLGSPLGLQNVTYKASETTFIEPSMGVPAYTSNNTLDVYLTASPALHLIYLTYRDSNESMASGINDAKAAYNGSQIINIYVPTALGAIVAILVIGLAFNIRRIRRKKPPKQQPQH